MSPEEKKELERLIELKKMQEKLQVLAMKERLELDKLLSKPQYQQYENLTGTEIETHVQKQPPVEPVAVRSEEPDTMDLIIQDYKAKYNRDPVKNPDGSVSLYFEPSKKTGSFMDAVAEFAEEQAEKNREFVITNKDNKVLAYSTGDGKLYHGDGSEFQSGDKLKPSNVGGDEFEFPGRSSSPGM